jgi:hypothetical protein
MLQTPQQPPQYYDQLQALLLSMHSPRPSAPVVASRPSVSWVTTRGRSIPAGAFIGGKDEGGEVLFVGRAKHQGSLTPGKVQSSA